jgi:hypothetical protein
MSVPSVEVFPDRRGREFLIGKRKTFLLLVRPIT